jgi:hypothetical protein
VTPDGAAERDGLEPEGTMSDLPDLVQPVVQTMVAMIHQSTADSTKAMQLEALVRSSCEISTCALGGGGLITWTNGSYAGCVG